jgi:hypothetical protein
VYEEAAKSVFGEDRHGQSVSNRSQG